MCTLGPRTWPRGRLSSAPRHRARRSCGTGHGVLFPSGPAQPCISPVGTAQDPSTLAAPLEGPGQVGVGPWVLVPLVRLPREGRRDPGAPSGRGLQPSWRPCPAGQRGGSKVRRGPALENVPSCGTGGGASSCAWLVCWHAGNGPAHQELAPLRLRPRTCPHSSPQGRWTCHFVQQRLPSPPQARAQRLGLCGTPGLVQALRLGSAAARHPQRQASAAMWGQVAMQGAVGWSFLQPREPGQPGHAPVPLGLRRISR